MAVFMICNTSPFTHSTPPHELQTSLPHHAVRFQEKVPRFQEKVPRFQEKHPTFPRKYPTFPRKSQTSPRKSPTPPKDIPHFGMFFVMDFPTIGTFFCIPRRNLPSQPHFLYNTYEINTLFQGAKALFRQVNAYLCKINYTTTY